MNVRILTKTPAAKAAHLLEAFIGQRIALTTDSGVMGQGKLTGLVTGRGRTSVELDGEQFCETHRIRSLVIGGVER